MQDDVDNPIKDHSKKSYIFVGAFEASKDGTLGGVQFACRSLVSSQLSNYVNWHLLNTMQQNFELSNFFFRLLETAKRLSVLLWYLITRKSDGVLLFSSFSKFGFLEKGVMCILGKLFRKRIVLSIRSEIKLSKMLFYSRFPWFADRFVRLVLRCCDAVVCSNEIAAETLVELFQFDRAKISVIGNWIDSKPYMFPRPDASSTQSISKLLYVGWMVKTKGIYELMEAIKVLVDKKYSLNLVMCGGGTELEPVQEKVKELGLDEHVKFCGWVSGDEKYDYFRNADMFVFPTYTEGMPNALIEAMVSGLPAVTTPVGGIPALITHDENGLLVEPATVQPLADAIEQFLTDPAKAHLMGQKSRQHILKNHNLDHLWKKFANALQVDINEG